VIGTSTAAILEACTRDHKVSVTATLRTKGGSTTALTVLGGSVEVNGDSGVRRSCQLDLLDVDGTLLPRSYNDPLTPFGSEIIINWVTTDPSAGVSYTTQLGVFVITSVGISAESDGTHLTVQGEDRAFTVAKRKLTSSFLLSNGTSNTDAIAQIVRAVAPEYSANISLATTVYTIDDKFAIKGDDPWATCQALAEAVGQEIYFDNTGNLRSTTVPPLSSNAVASFLNDSSGVILSVSRTLDGETVRNGVSFTAEATALTSAYLGEAWDTDPSSATNITTSGYGKRPIDIRSQFARTADQSSAVANLLLPKYIGQPITLSMVPIPCLDVRDIIRVQTSSIGLDTNVIIDRISLPLSSSDPMTVEGRARSI
jgi:hypothetical protein